MYRGVRIKGVIDMEKSMEENSMNKLKMIKIRNHYIILIGLILILISSGFCMFRDWKRRVQEPVMLPIGMEVSVEQINPDENNGKAQIKLFYITDNKHENFVRGITFPERPDLNCFANEDMNNSVFTNNTFFANDSSNSWRQYGRYQIHQIMVEFVQVHLEEEITLTQAELIWNNNKHTVVDIGKVILYNDDYSQISLEMNYSSSSTDGTLEVGMEVLDDITVESIESPLLPYAEGKFTITINGNTYQAEKLNSLDLNFKKGDYLEITFNAQGLMKQKYDQYYLIDIRPKLIFKEKNGKQGYTLLSNMRSSMEYKLKSEKLIYQYLKEREDRNE